MSYAVCWRPTFRRPPILKQVAKQLVVGTRWESFAKRAHFTLTRNKNSLYDSQTIAIMRRVLGPASNAIDVGCFEGGMLRHMIRLAPEGHHLAFEPVPENFERLKRTFAGTRIYPYALGPNRGDASFHRVADHPALSGLRRRIDLPDGERGNEIRVTMEALDNVVPSDFTVAFVKIDVEGAELGVLQGALRTLRRSRPVVAFECGLGGTDTYGVKPGEIFDFLAEQAGLKLSLLGAWLAKRDPLSRDAFIEQFENGINYFFVAHP